METVFWLGVFFVALLCLDKLIWALINRYDARQARLEAQQHAQRPSRCDES